MRICMLISGLKGLKVINKASHVIIMFSPKIGQMSIKRILSTYIKASIDFILG